MPAELRLYRIGKLSGIHLEGDIGKFGHHLIFGEVAEIAALGGSGILGFFLGQLCEIGAALELFDNGLRFIFAFDQDVAGAHLFLPAHGFHRLIVGLFQGFVGERGFGFLLQLVSHQ